MPDHLSWIYERYLRHGRLFHVHIDATWRCPLRCRHCYLGGNAPEELSLEVLVDVLDQLAELGVLSLLFSGGEVFARSDFLDLLRAARRRGFMVMVKTSGTRCSAEDCEAMAKMGVRTVHVSMYSHRAAIHDDVTRTPGSFEKSLATILRLQKLGVRAEAVVTLLKGYEEDLASVRRGLEELGVAAVSINELKDVSCFEGYPLDGLFMDSGEQQNQWEEAFGDRPPQRTAPSSEPLCLAGRLAAYIGPDGGVRPCLEWPTTIGNVLDAPLAEIWRDHPDLAALRGLTWESSERCLACGDRAWCQPCPARSMRETGDPARPAPSICERTAQWRRLVSPPEGEKK